MLSEFDVKSTESSDEHIHPTRSAHSRKHLDDLLGTSDGGAGVLGSNELAVDNNVRPPVGPTDKGRAELLEPGAERQEDAQAGDVSSGAWRMCERVANVDAHARPRCPRARVSPRVCGERRAAYLSSISTELPVTQSVAPTAASSALVKEVTFLPATSGVWSGFLQSIKPIGPWQSAASSLPRASGHAEQGCERASARAEHIQRKQKNLNISPRREAAVGEGSAGSGRAQAPCTMLMSPAACTPTKSMQQP